MRKAIITIAGKPGSGKSTTANILAETLGYERFSAGKFLRDIAAAHGMSTEAASRMAIENPSVDHELDALTEKTGKERERIVVDGRLAFHFIPESFKVYLDLDLETAAKRIFGEGDRARRESGDLAASAEETETLLERRLASEQERYRSLYGIDPHDKAHFDLVLDTATDPPRVIAAKIIEAYEKWQA